MSGSHAARVSINGGAERDHVNLLLGANVVTVLFFAAIGRGALLHQNASDTLVRVFEFACEFHTHMGRGHIDGLTASDGDQQRIVICWIEPRLLREVARLVRYSDFIFAPDAVHYWVYGMAEPQTIRPSDLADIPLSPEDNSAESLARSVAAIVGRMGWQNKDEHFPVELDDFFQASRGQSRYTQEALPQEAASHDREGSVVGETRTPDVGVYRRREYSKETQTDGTVLWNVRRATSGEPVVTVTVTPVRKGQRENHSVVFDPNTLGRCTLVPNHYQTYWSFDKAYCELSNSSDVHSVSQELDNGIETYLNSHVIPAQVRHALGFLRFKTALMTSDAGRVQRSARAYVDGLCRDSSVDVYPCFMDVAIIAGEVEEQYPRQEDQWLRSLVRQMVQRVSRDTMGEPDRLMASIEANRSFSYGRLLLEEFHDAGVIDGSSAAAMAARLEAMRISRTLQPVDPCESLASVVQYMTRLDDAPFRGSLDMDDLRSILENGLAKAYAHCDPEMKRKVVADVLRSTRLIVGEGPFCGDEAKLIASIERFSILYLVVCKVGEPIDTVLATLLALCFCDTSTQQDHEILLSQFQKRCGELRRQVNVILSDRGLGSMVTAEDVNGVFVLYERIFRSYVDDPLWPVFKFPFTSNEESRLTASLKLRFMELETTLDPLSIKVKHGGASPELKEKTILAISLAVQQLLPQAAFLRRPPYPGVSCEYRGGYGFSVAIREALYKEGQRAKEKFMAMRYFHLGHRLQEVVEHEREVMRPAHERETR